MGLYYMTKDEKAYKALIMADLNIVYHYADSKKKSEKLQAAYHMQQAIEKTIKLKAMIRGVNLWGHDINKLIISCQKADIGINIPKLIKRNAMMYTRWEASCRYAPATVVNKNSIWAAYRVIVAWLESGDTEK